MAAPPKVTFDAVVVGTGLTEALVAGALARAGKKVLHLDRNDSYGGQYSTLSLQQAEEWAQSLPSSIAELEQQQQQQQVDGGKQSLPITYLPPFFNASIVHYTEEDSEERKQLKKESRRYNLDLTAKPILANGLVVDLLVHSGVSRYLEFRAVESTLIAEQQAADKEWSFEKVPCSKGDVFSNKSISLVDKRHLMKLLNLCLALDDLNESDKAMLEEWKDKPFVDFLASQGLSPRMQTVITHALALATGPQTTTTGLSNLQRTLRSLGKFGPTPYLYPFYGVSELTQAFCRVCAVYGGTYVLRKQINSCTIPAASSSSDSSMEVEIPLEDGERPFVFEQAQAQSPEEEAEGQAQREGDETETVPKAEKVEEQKPTSQSFNAKWFISSSDYLPAMTSSISTSPDQYISRAIIVTDGPILPSNSGTLVAFLCFGRIDPSIRVIQLDSSLSMAPKGKYVIHLSSTGSKERLEQAVSELFLLKSTPCSAAEAASSDAGSEEATASSPAAASAPTKPHILWAMYFQQVRRSAASDSLPKSVRIVDDVSAELHFDRCVEEARRIFVEIAGAEAEFLPAIPNPDADLVDE